jgi:hypothetical protein
VNDKTANNVAPQEISLICHPSTASVAARSISVAAQRLQDTAVHLRYCLAGDIAALIVPLPGVPRRGHELWNHTCFEAFVAADGVGHYYEFNFSPSRAWAIYRLSAYRQGLTPVDMAQPAKISVECDARELILDAEVDLSLLPDLAHGAELRLALTAVVEDTQHRLSYWSLSHPSPAPDFHHPGGFLLSLPARQGENARSRN